MTDFYPEGQIFDTEENRKTITSKDLLLEACGKQKIFESIAKVCDSKHNLLVSLGTIKGIIPKEESAMGIENSGFRDIAIISKVNQPVCFMVKDIIKDENDKEIAILSRKDAQKYCFNEYISKLKPGDIINAQITHMETFGAFADIGCGITSFLPIDTISVSRISHPKDRFKNGMKIKAIVKSLENGRVCLTHKELLGTWEENADLFSIGETVAGIIRSVEDYGIFVELTPNLAGLAEFKEGVERGQQASVFIKNIIKEKMKIKLVIIDSFNRKNVISEPKYFFKGSHIDKFVYSPLICKKLIETSFHG